MTAGNLLAATLGLTALTTSSGAQQQYRILDIGTLGGSDSIGIDINADGAVVGSAFDANNNDRPFYWDGSKLIDLGELENGHSGVGSALGINDAEQITGRSGGHAFFWQSGVMTAITTPGSHTYGYGESINEDGVVAGHYSYRDSPSVVHAFVWDQKNLRELESFGPGDCSANDISDLGVVVGESHRPESPHAECAVRWVEGVVEGLGLLPSYEASAAYAVNNSGDIVGSCFQSKENPEQATLWSNDEIIPLGMLDPAEWSRALDINADGNVVGIATNSLGERAVMWHDATLIDLNQFVFGTGWILTAATSINDAGQITGFGRLNGDTRAFLLSPVSYSLEVDPLVAGQIGHARVAGASIAAHQFLAYSLAGPGATLIPPLNVVLDLESPRLAGIAVSDVNGEAAWSLSIPLKAAGLEIWIQAAEQNQVTNVVSMLIK